MIKLGGDVSSAFQPTLTSSGFRYRRWCAKLNALEGALKWGLTFETRDTRRQSWTKRVSCQSSGSSFPCRLERVVIDRWSCYEFCTIQAWHALQLRLFGAGLNVYGNVHLILCFCGLLLSFERDNSLRQLLPVPNSSNSVQAFLELIEISYRARHRNESTELRKLRLC